MHVRTGPFATIGFLLLAASSLGAQIVVPPEGIDSGTVIRVHLQNDGVEAGRLLAPLRPGSATAEYCLFPAPPCARGSTRHVQRSLEDALALDRYGGTRFETGALVGAALGAALGVTAILAARGAEEPRVGYVYAALSVTLFTGVGAFVGLTIPVWHRVTGGST